MKTNQASYAGWLSDGAESVGARPLTDEERDAFERGYRANAKEALMLARATAGVTRNAAHDIVHGAIGRMIHKTVVDGAACPADDAAFRGRFLAYVRNVSQQVAAAPAQSTQCTSQESAAQRKYWGESLAPVSQRRVPERDLLADMDRLDQPKRKNAKHDRSQGAPWMPVRSRVGGGPFWPKVDRTVLREDLDYILKISCAMLAGTQQLVIEGVLDGKRRAEIAAALGMSTKTVNTHIARAKARLREILVRYVWIVPNGMGRPAGTHWSEWNVVFGGTEARPINRFIEEAPPMTFDIAA